MLFKWLDIIVCRLTFGAHVSHADAITGLRYKNCSGAAVF